MRIHKIYYSIPNVSSFITYPPYIYIVFFIYVFINIAAHKQRSIKKTFISSSTASIFGSFGMKNENEKKEKIIHIDVPRNYTAMMKIPWLPQNRFFFSLYLSCSTAMMRLQPRKKTYFFITSICEILFVCLKNIFHIYYNIQRRRSSRVAKKSKQISLIIFQVSYRCYIEKESEQKNVFGINHFLCQI